MTEGMLRLITGWNTKVRSLSDGKLVHGMCEWRQSDGLSILGSAKKAKCRRRCIAGVSDRIKLIRERGRQRHRDRGRFEWFKNTNQITENSQCDQFPNISGQFNTCFKACPPRLTPLKGHSWYLVSTVHGATSQALLVELRDPAWVLCKLHLQSAPFFRLLSVKTSPQLSALKLPCNLGGLFKVILVSENSIYQMSPILFTR